MKRHPRPRPPRLGLWIARWLAGAEYRDEVIGDLTEGWELRQARGEGVHRAFWRDVVSIRRSYHVGAPARRPTFHGVTHMLHDLRYALRLARRQPSYTAIVIATLAIGIGATSTVFTVADRVLLRPLPFPRAAELMWVNNASFSFNGPRMDVAKSLQTSGAFAEIGLFAAGGLNLGSDQEPVRVRAAGASAGFMRALGVHPTVGRLFTTDEDVASAHVAVLSDHLWRTRFGARADILATPLLLNGQTFDIVGVMPPHFGFPGDSDVWVPASSDLQLTGAAFAPQVIGRLAAGIDARRAGELLNQVAETRRQRNPGVEIDAATVTPLQTQLGGKSRPTLLLLTAVVALLMLATTANVAGLMLSRMRGREQEIAVRTAVGAGRAAIVRQLLIEAGVMTLFAAVVGVTLSVWALHGVRAVAPDFALDAGITVFDVRFAAVNVGVMAIAALLFGAGPALVATRHKGTALRTSRTISESGSRMRSALVMAQVAAALVLLTVSASAALTLMRFAAVDHGFHNASAVTFELTLPLSRYPTPASVNALQERIVAQLTSTPGIRRAGASSMAPGTRGVGISLALSRADQPGGGPGALTRVVQLVASPGYFAALDIPLIAGRTFTGDDRAGSVPVVILSETAARAVWADPMQAIGRTLRVTLGRTPLDMQLVGIVSDVRLRTLQGDATGQAYLPFAQRPTLGLASLVVDSSLNASQTDRAIRSALGAVDPTLPPYNVTAIRNLRSSYLANERLTMWLTTFFAIASLLLCAIGLYGVLSQTVASRTREIGIRMALGADARRMRWQVVATGVRVAVAGVAAGGLVAWLTAKSIAAYVPGLSAPPLWAIVILAIVLLIVALIAAWLPARRASAVDPVIALRTQ